MRTSLDNRSDSFFELNPMCDTLPKGMTPQRIDSIYREAPKDIFYMDDEKIPSKSQNKKSSSTIDPVNSF